MKNTFKTVRRAAVEHPFLAASIVAAGALFKDNVLPDQPSAAAASGEAPVTLALQEANGSPDLAGRGFDHRRSGGVKSPL